MKKKILIVDDEEGDRELIREALFRSGFDFEVMTADTGERAVEKAKIEKPDIVILDTNLPGINGFETCRQIKRLYPSDFIKIIVVTGLIDAVDAGKARQHGADDYCAKSSDCEEVIAAVKDLG